jgi:RecJ-like exonuclease
VALIETVMCQTCRGQGFTSIGIKCIDCNGSGMVRRKLDMNRHHHTNNCKNCALKKRVEKLEAIIFQNQGEINGNQ